MDRILGYAKLSRVRLPGGAVRKAWDCRPFGLGRVIAPQLDTAIDLAEGVRLHLANGELRAQTQHLQRSA